MISATNNKFGIFSLIRRKLNIIIFIFTVSFAGVVFLLVVRAATQIISIESQAQLNGAVKKVTDSTAASGDYLSFGSGASSGGGGEITDKVLPPGEIPAYPKPPAPNGTTIVEVKDNGSLKAAIENDNVRIIVMLDGNYQNQDVNEAVVINGKTNKTLWAVNKHGAYLRQKGYRNFDNLHIVNSNNITIRGLALYKAQNYALKVGAGGNGYAGPNKNILIEHVLIEDSAQSGLAVENGWASNGTNCKTPPEDQTRNVMVRYNEFYKIGMDPLYGAGFTEAVYLGSGGSCQAEDTNWGVTLQNNIFDGTGQYGPAGGEAIGAKTNSRDLLIENNLIKNWKLTTASDGGAIGVWIDRGQPVSAREGISAGPKGIIIRGNIIDTIGTTNTSNRKGCGIMVGHAAIVENNTIRNTQHGGLCIRVGSSDWGFSNSKEVDVYVKNNTFANNGETAFMIDQSGDQPFTTKIHASGNQGVSNYPTAGNDIEWVTKD